MKYKVNNEEKVLLNTFRELRIPSIFKTDDTDRILFVEDIDFTICDYLLKGKSISSSLYDEIVERCERFINDTDIKEFDDYALNYYNLCLQIVEMMKKYARNPK